MSGSMREHIQDILLNETEIRNKVKEMGAQISRDYAGKEPLLVSVLRGSIMFTADLARQIEPFCEIDFIGVTSYGNATVSSGQVKILKDLTESIENRDVLVVEDILDSGNTLSYLMELLQTRKPASIRLCTLLDKPDRRIRPIHADYVGFQIPDVFVVGYGLDYCQRYRNLPYIGILKPEIYGQ